MREVKYASEDIFTKTPHISPWQASYGGVFFEDFGENWLRYNGTALYLKHEDDDSFHYSMVSSVMDAGSCAKDVKAIRWYLVPFSIFEQVLSL